jgi:hypothetical protein
MWSANTNETPFQPAKPCSLRRHGTRRTPDLCILATGLCLFAGVACSSSSKNPSQCTDSGSVTGSTDSGMLKLFSSPGNPGAKGIWITASGEVLALGGYAFPPATTNSVAFVDGWEVRFSELLVTFDNIRLSENPDLNPGDQSLTGNEVAKVSGPWAVDLHKGGTLAGKGGVGERAVPIAALTGQNENGCNPFDLTQRYAFSYNVVPATNAAMNVNLDDHGLADYTEMIAKGYTVLYVGTATFRGTNCTPDDPVFRQAPLNVGSSINFRLGFKSPTSYINCQNPDNQAAMPFEGEEYQRGVYALATQSTIAQMTIHTDHPFWDSTIHDSPAHFDQIAARYTGAAGTITATVEDFSSVDFTYFADAQGNPLPWRDCVGSSFVPPDSLTMHFTNAAGVALANYAEFMTFNQHTQGHLNSDGLCYVKSL